MIYIYELIDPRNNDTKYIGKTINIDNRLQSHIEEARYNRKSRRSYKNNWIRGLLNNKMTPIINIYKPSYLNTVDFLRKS